MSKAITQPKLKDVVVDGAAAAIRAAAEKPSVSAAEAIKAAREVATEVVQDSRIAPALEPVPKFESETIRGIHIAAGAPLLVAILRTAGVEMAEGDAATIVAALASLAGGAYAWYGRSNTTCPSA